MTDSNRYLSRAEKNDEYDLPAGNAVLNVPAVAGGVAVNLSFSALVRQLPQKQTRSIASTCTARGVTLSASGSVRTKVKALTVDGEKRDEFNVYPGTPKEVMGQRISLDGKVLCQGRSQ